MKKTTFTLLSIFSLFITLSFGQTINTQEFVLSATPNLEYSAKIEVSTTLVTLTLIGPDDRWLGLGFGVPRGGDFGEDHPMTPGGDVVIFDGTTLTDRTYDGTTIPLLDAQQDWTVISNVVNSKVRTLMATRNRVVSDSDYEFNTTDTSITLAWARGNTDFNLGWHWENRSTLIANFNPLSTSDQNINTFSISPNPGKLKMNLKLSRLKANTKVEVFDVLGKKIYRNGLTDVTSSIDVSKWNSGVYLVRVSTDTGVQTKRFVKQ